MKPEETLIVSEKNIKLILLNKWDEIDVSPERLEWIKQDVQGAIALVRKVFYKTMRKHCKRIEFDKGKYAWVHFPSGLTIRPFEGADEVYKRDRVKIAFVWKDPAERVPPPDKGI